MKMKLVKGQKVTVRFYNNADRHNAYVEIEGVLLSRVYLENTWRVRLEDGEVAEVEDCDIC